LGVAGYLMIGFSKAGFGTGTGSLVVPLLAMTVPVPRRPPSFCPPCCSPTSFTLWRYRRHCDWMHLRIILPGVFSVLPEIILSLN
jgi:uncharacterized protein